MPPGQLPGTMWDLHAKDMKTEQQILVNWLLFDFFFVLFFMYEIIPDFLFFRKNKILSYKRIGKKKN